MLIPASAVQLSLKLESKNREQIRKLAAIVRSYVKGYQASWEVVLRRFLDLNAISEETYYSSRAELKELFMPKIKKDAGFANWIDQQYAARGNNYINLVLIASNAGKITKSDMSTMLGIKLNHLPKLEKKISKHKL
jgi:hypothetical protein